MAGEFRADFPDPIAQSDYIVELFQGEHAEVLGLLARNVDAAGCHHPHHIRVQRLGVTARAERADPAAGVSSGERFSCLRPGAVARA